MTFFASSTSWQPLPSAKFSKVCCGEGVVGHVAMRDAGDAAGVELLRGRPGSCRRCRAPAARPCRTGPCGRTAAAPSRREGTASCLPSCVVSSSARGENVPRPSSSTTALAASVSSRSLVDICAHRGQRQRADHVGQLAGRRGRGDQLVNWFSSVADDLDLDAGLLGELVGDLLGRLDPVGLVLQAPHRDLLSGPAVATGSAAGDRAGGDDRGRGGHQRSVPHRRPPFREKCRRYATRSGSRVRCAMRSPVLVRSSVPRQMGSSCSMETTPS